MSYARLLHPPDRSFFLFGPRGVGKSTWLKEHFSQATLINLLEYQIFLELSSNPARLEALIGKQARTSWICLDEIQRVPELLNEVHRLIEKCGYRFALTGSSARKLKRGGANLLGGRAITLHMDTFTSRELGPEFSLEDALQWGLLPLVVLNPKDRQDILRSYVETYLREEITAEGLVRKLPPFLRFLEIAAQLHGQVLNVENIAREAQIARSNADQYLAILQDTLLVHTLPAYQPRAKVRERAHPKLYWFDNGVARAASGLLYDPPEASWLGFALESLVYHELQVYNQVQNKHRALAYYQASSSGEIDFIIETRKATRTQRAQVLCLEVKSATKWKNEWESPMRRLAASGAVQVKAMIGVYRGAQSYHFNGVDVWPASVFLQKLHAGEIF